MTTLVYGEVVLRDCDTSAMQQTVEYDESNTDVLFSRFKIRVSSTLVAIRNQEGKNEFGMHTPLGTTVVQRMHDVQGRLSEARKDFWLLVDDCVQDERQGTPAFNAPTLDQPLLVACGEAYSETMEDIYEEGEVVGQRVLRTPLTMPSHPFSANSTTRRYGPGGVEFEKHLVLDCNNGPKPLDVSVTQILGGRSFRVEFEIEVCLKICNEEFGDDKPTAFGEIAQDSRVLSNRWSLDESKDANWVSTKVIQGTLRVAHSSYWPHMMRFLCLPPLLKGYRRMKQSFVSDPTDTILKYRIEDKQMHAAPPLPAIDFSGHHTESASGSAASIKTGEFQIRLTGPPGVDKQELIGAAGKVAVNRIKGLVPSSIKETETKSAFSTIINNVSIIDLIDQPTIEMRIQVRYTDLSYKALALRLKEMGRPLDMGEPTPEPEPGEDPEENPDLIDGYDPLSWPVPLPYDSQTPAGVLNCYLQHPCSVWHGIPTGYTPASEGVDEAEREEIKSSGDTDSVLHSEDHEIADDEGEYTEDATLQIYKFPYTYVDLRQRYELSNGWQSFPLATTAPGGRSAALVKMHNKTARRILTMTATRNGLPPVVPSLAEDIIDENGHREVLQQYAIEVSDPKLGPNGRAREFMAEVEYVYLMESAPAENEKLRGVSSPLDRFSPDSNHLDLSKIVDTGGRIEWRDGVTQTYPLIT